MTDPDKLPALPEPDSSVDYGIWCVPHFTVAQMRSYALTAIKAERAQADALQAELRIAEAKNRGSLANNLCPDHRDKQTFKPCLSCTIETLEKRADALEAENATLKETQRKFGVMMHEEMNKSDALEAALRAALKHADSNGMQGWSVFNRLRAAMENKHG